MTGDRRPMLTIRKWDKLTIRIVKCHLSPGKSSTPVRPPVWSTFGACSHGLSSRLDTEVLAVEWPAFSCRKCTRTESLSLRQHLARWFRLAPPSGNIACAREIHRDNDLRISVSQVRFRPWLPYNPRSSPPGCKCDLDDLDGFRCVMAVQVTRRTPARTTF